MACVLKALSNLARLTRRRASKAFAKGVLNLCEPVLLVLLNSQTNFCYNRSRYVDLASALAKNTNFSFAWLTGCYQMAVGMPRAESRLGGWAGGGGVRSARGINGRILGRGGISCCQSMRSNQSYLRRNRHLAPVRCSLTLRVRRLP